MMRTVAFFIYGCAVGAVLAVLFALDRENEQLRGFDDDLGYD